MNNYMYQVSTLQALLLGYFKEVTTVGELLKHGDTGLGTFTNVNGEMIVVDGICYRALNDGKIELVDNTFGVPFASVCNLDKSTPVKIDTSKDIESMKVFLNNQLDENFGLNSIHIVRIDGYFNKVYARSESAYESQHIELKNVLSKVQTSFEFENVKGTLACVYYPDYMDGINASGWHFHFISDDKTKGGHIYEFEMENGTAYINKIHKLHIELPADPAFDTYLLKQASEEDVKSVEQKTLK